MIYHLGDRWAIASWLLRESQLASVSIKIPKYFEQEFSEVIPLFDSTGVIEFVDNLPSGEKYHFDYSAYGYHMNTYDVNYIPTRIRWQNKHYKRVCYQYDGRWCGGDKNPPSKDLPRLVNFVKDVEFIKLDNTKSLSECINIMSSSDVFLGVCSGMSHVCHSVGTPMYLIEYKLDLNYAHKNKKFTKCCGTDDAIFKVKQYFNGLLSADRPIKNKFAIRMNSYKGTKQNCCKSIFHDV